MTAIKVINISSSYAFVCVKNNLSKECIEEIINQRFCLPIDFIWTIDENEILPDGEENLSPCPFSWDLINHGPDRIHVLLKNGITDVKEMFEMNDTYN